MSRVETPQVPERLIVTKVDGRVVVVEVDDFVDLALTGTGNITIEGSAAYHQDRLDRHMLTDSED